MAITIDYDRLGSDFTGERLTSTYLRKARVRGLEETDPIALLAEILTALPPINTKLPDPFNMYLDRLTINKVVCAGGPSNPGYADVDLIYIFRSSSYMTGGGGVPDDNGPSVRISSGGAIYQVETTRDAASQEITTTFDNVTQAHRVGTFAVQSAPTFQRLEQNDPQSRADTHVGTLNDSLWNGYAARTVLCVSIQGVSDNNGDDYRVEYTFHYRPDGWAYSAIHDDPFFPGNPLPGFTPVVYDVIPTSDFGLLNL